MVSQRYIHQNPMGSFWGPYITTSHRILALLAPGMKTANPLLPRVFLEHLRLYRLNLILVPHGAIITSTPAVVSVIIQLPSVCFCSIFIYAVLLSARLRRSS